MARDEWLASYAAALGVPPPGEDDIGVLLKIAAIAAHVSEDRTAAPVACWLVAKSGSDPAAALEAARKLRREQ